MSGLHRTLNAIFEKKILVALWGFESVNLDTETAREPFGLLIFKI